MSALGKMIADRMKSKAASSGDDAGAENDGEEESSADDSEGEGEGSYDSVESDAADELASLCGVADGDKAAFKTALSQYVKACMNKTEADEPADDQEGE